MLGAEAGRAVRVESDVCVEILKESRVVLLEEMDIGVKAVDDGNGGGEETRPLSEDKGICGAILREQFAAQFVMNSPEIGFQLKATTEEGIGFCDFPLIEKERAQGDARLGIFVVA